MWQEKASKAGGKALTTLAAIVVAMAVIATSAAAHSMYGTTPQTASAATAPIIKSGFKDGPVDVPDSPGSLAKLHLGVGAWAIAAKALFLNAGANGGPMICDLIAGADFDVGRTDLGVGYNGHEQTIALTVVHTFDTKGVADLECTDNGIATASAYFIKITAWKAGSLKNVSL